MNVLIVLQEAHSVRDFVNAAFGAVNIKLRWEGTGVNEVGIDEASGIVRVKVNPQVI
jgi:GDPmannose 4,6-dehydratase